MHDVTCNFVVMVVMQCGNSGPNDKGCLLHAADKALVVLLASKINVACPCGDSCHAWCGNGTRPVAVLLWK